MHFVNAFFYRVASCFGECRKVLQWIGTKQWPDPKENHLCFNMLQDS
jgi:hypothetical protein